MVKYCKWCLFPETKPDLYFNDEGVCDACLSAKSKHGFENAINWDKRAEQFEKIIRPLQKEAGGWYDCIIPVSGGKDSTWQTYAMKVLHKMNPLTVTFDQFDQTETGVQNLKALQSIGVDHLHFTFNPIVIKLLVRKGFEIVGDPYWVNHVGMFTVPFHISIRFSIPLVIFGEQPQLEYGGPLESRSNMIMDKRWRQEFGGMRGFREEDMIDDEISEQDLRILKYPSNEDMESVGVKGLFYGYFFHWDAAKHIRTARKYGWSSLPKPPDGSWVDYENCDMKFIDIREHLKFMKYGYGRATDQLNIEIRNERITRAEAMRIAREIDGKYSKNNVIEFCDYIEISLARFWEIRDSFVNQDLFERKSGCDWVLTNPVS